MNKGKWICFFILVLFGVARAMDPGFDRENISIKAGPTEPGEGISIVWVESIVYPKTVDKEDYLSLSVRTATSVKKVRASSDFNRQIVDLTSNDGKSWTGIYRVPGKASEGVHIIRYNIAGNKGSIQRTVDFAVDHSPNAEEKAFVATAKDVVRTTGWPLTVNSTCSALSGDTVRTVRAGQIVIGISKTPWYKVVFEDGKEGWISAQMVKEPTEDYYQLGYGAFKEKNYPIAAKYYQQAIDINPRFVKAYVWLSKSYLAMDKLDLAADTITSALAQDERDISIRVVADQIVQKLFAGAHESYLYHRNKDAAAKYKSGLAIKPESPSAWIELGESLRRIGLESEARDAFRSALKYDPNNTRIYALLGLDRRMASGGGSARGAVADIMLNDSVKLVRGGKTQKGTKIENALGSVVSLTKSLGTPVAVKGWNIKKQGQKYLVSYQCQQSGGANETFDWLVDVDTKYVSPSNDNARLLMSRW